MSPARDYSQSSEPMLSIQDIDASEPCTQNVIRHFATVIRPAFSGLHKGLDASRTFRSNALCVVVQRCLEIKVDRIQNIANEYVPCLLNLDRSPNIHPMSQSWIIGEYRHAVFARIQSLFLQRSLDHHMMPRQDSRVFGRKPNIPLERRDPTIVRIVEEMRMYLHRVFGGSPWRGRKSARGPERRWSDRRTLPVVRWSISPQWYIVGVEGIRRVPRSTIDICLPWPPPTSWLLSPTSAMHTTVRLPMSIIFLLDLRRRGYCYGPRIRTEIMNDSSPSSARLI